MVYEYRINGGMFVTCYDYTERDLKEKLRYHNRDDYIELRRCDPHTKLFLHDKAWEKLPGRRNFRRVW